MAINQSGDKASLGTKSRIVSRKKGYSDLDLRLKVHPTFGDIIPLKDIDAVKQSVKNLVLTSKGDRPFQPWLGSGLRDLLFEPADNITMVGIKQEIQEVILKYEPRTKINSISIDHREELNSYYVTLNLTIVNLEESVDVDFYLERVR